MICKMNFDDYPLPFGWAWCDIWKVDVNEDTDADGWKYSKQLKAHTGWFKVGFCWLLVVCWCWL